MGFEKMLKKCTLINFLIWKIIVIFCNNVSFTLTSNGFIVTLKELIFKKILRFLISDDRY